MLLQTPESAQFDGMPKSAIQTGIADNIAPPENMPQKILRYVERPYDSVLRNGPPVFGRRRCTAQTSCSPSPRNWGRFY